MVFSLTFGGVPFSLPTDEVCEFVDWGMPLRDLRITSMESDYPGADLLALTIPTKRVAPPDLRLNEFFYPTGIRSSEFHGLMSQEQYDAIIPLAYVNGTPTALPFVMSQQGQTITTPMYLIEAKPLAKNGKLPGMYLIILRDDRWFWQFQKTTNLNINTWAHLIDGLTTFLGISPTLPSISADYGVPLPNSPWTLPDCRADLWLEAALWNVGLQLIRNFDSTYVVMTPAASNVQAQANRNTTREAGADAINDILLSNANPNVTANGLVPESINVTFQKVYANCYGYINGGQDDVPYSRNIGDRYTVNISLADAGFSLNGQSFELTFNDLAEAIYTGAALQNGTELNALALKIATDYYNSVLNGLCETYCGVVVWVPEGQNDLIYRWDLHNQSTMVQGRPINYMFNYFLHHFADAPTPGCASSTLCLKLITNAIVNPTPTIDNTTFTLCLKLIPTVFNTPPCADVQTYSADLYLLPVVGTLLFRCTTYVTADGIYTDAAGLVFQCGDICVLKNEGSFDLTTYNYTLTLTAGAPVFGTGFTTPNGSDISIAPGESLSIYYNGTVWQPYNITPYPQLPTFIDTSNVTPRVETLHGYPLIDLNPTAPIVISCILGNGQPARQQVTFTNISTSVVTFTNAGGGCGASTSINTGTGQDLLLYQYQQVTFEYNESSAAWGVIGSPVFAPTGSPGSLQFSSSGPFFNGSLNLKTTTGSDLVVNTDITSTTGNITSTAGNIVATAAQVIAGTTMTAATGIDCTLNDIFAHAGNLHCAGGGAVNISSAAGAVNSVTNYQTAGGATKGIVGTAGQNAGIIGDALADDTCISANNKSVRISTNNGASSLINFTTGQTTVFQTHIASEGTPPAAVTGPGAGGPGGGSGAICTGNDTSGTIQITTAAVSTLAGIIATITYNVARESAPFAVLVLPADFNSALAVAGGSYVYSPTAALTNTTWTIINAAGSTPLTGGTVYTYYYFIC